MFVVDVREDGSVKFTNIKTSYGFFYGFLDLAFPSPSILIKCLQLAT